MSLPSLTPLEARVAMLGMITSGLCQDTSAQPRFSTVIITMLGRLKVRVERSAQSKTERRNEQRGVMMLPCPS